MIVAARRCCANTVAKRGFAQDNLIHKPRGTIMFIKSDYPGELHNLNCRHTMPRWFHQIAFGLAPSAAVLSLPLIMTTAAGADALPSLTLTRIRCSLDRLIHLLGGS
jgi:hypothetical protein